MRKNECAAQPKRVFHVAELAKELRIGLRQAYELLAEGRIRSVRVGKRILIPASEVDRFLGAEDLRAA
jgi:excisionase family DNA binding protein